MYANSVFLESIIFNPSIIFVTNKPPFFHIEISSLMLHAGWQSSKAAAAGTPAGFIRRISAHFSHPPLEARYRSERMIAFKAACVPADCLSSHKRREFYGFNSCRAAAAQLKMHHIKPDSRDDRHEEELCLFFFFSLPPF